MLEDLPLFDAVLFWWICIAGTMYAIISGTLKTVSNRLSNKLKMVLIKEKTTEPKKVE